MDRIVKVKNGPKMVLATLMPISNMLFRRVIMLCIGFNLLIRWGKAPLARSLSALIISTVTYSLSQDAQPIALKIVKYNSKYNEQAKS